MTPGEKAARRKAQKDASYQRNRDRVLAERRDRRAAQAEREGRTMRKVATKAEMQERLDALQGIADELGRATVRQIFYQATVRGFIEKTEAGYMQVGDALVKLRREGVIPWESIVDNTRSVADYQSFGSIQEALDHAARRYQIDFWKDQPERIQIWLEKDALAGVVKPVLDSYRVPLVVVRGYGSWSVMHEAAEHMAAFDVPTHVYHFGDYDPTGVDASRFIEDALTELASSEFEFERVAVTREQIRAFALPTRPTKQTDSRAASFGDDDSCELDAFTPDQLRGLVEEVINRHMTEAERDELEEAEEAEKAKLRNLVKHKRSRK